MGIAERRYSRTGGSGFFAHLTPVVKWLLILNVGIYFLDLILKGDDPNGPLRILGSFTMQSAFHGGKVWEFISFQFIHAFFGHLVFNCVGLFFFGPWLERWWGSVRFTAFYLLCGIGGALFFSLLVTTGILQKEVLAELDNGTRILIPMSGVPLMGASAGIYGILIGVAIIAPSLKVTLLFPPVTLTMRNLALISLAISVGSILLKFGGNEGGEAGHLGGAIVGFLLMRAAILWQGARDPLSQKAKEPRTDIPSKIRPRTYVDLRGQSEIDAILDKISKDGFQSITDEERDLLHRAAEKKQDQQ